MPELRHPLRLALGQTLFTSSAIQTLGEGVVKPPKAVRF